MSVVSILYTEASNEYLTCYWDELYQGSGLTIKYGCELCHTLKMPARNPYGKDIEIEMLKTLARLQKEKKEDVKDIVVEALFKVEGKDSDGDDVLNIAEIQSGTNPGEGEKAETDKFTEDWFEPAGFMNVPRYMFSMEKLNDGMVLITGGISGRLAPLSTAELFDSRNGKFLPTGKLNSVRWGHTSVLLHDGRVLIVGGRGDESKKEEKALNSVEIYDPVKGVFSLTGKMHYGRRGCTANLLPDGRVLVTGGMGYSDDGNFTTLKSAEIFDSKTNNFQICGEMTSKRVFHRAITLDDGRILITGGTSKWGAEGIDVLKSSEIYDPKTGKFIESAMMKNMRISHGISKLSNGNVMVFGAMNNPLVNRQALSVCEIFDVKKGEFEDAPSMNVPRDHFKPEVLDDGRVLAAGGSNLYDFHSSAEIFNPEKKQFNLTGRMSVCRDDPELVLLDDGRVLMAGGMSADYYILPHADYFNPSFLSRINGLKEKLSEIKDDEFSNVPIQGNIFKKLLSWISSSVQKKSAREMINVKLDELALSIKNHKSEETKNLIQGTLSLLDRKEGTLLASLFIPQLTLIKNQLEKLPEETNIAFDINSETSNEIDNRYSFKIAPDNNLPAIKSILWDFGDGSFSSQLNPEHEFCSGKHVVMTTVIFDDGRKSINRELVKVPGGEAGVSYQCDIQPLFDRNCIGCHGTLGGISLTSYEGLKKGSYRHKDVVSATKPEESPLIDSLVGKSYLMPPWAKWDDEKIELIKEWIENGAEKN